MGGLVSSFGRMVAWHRFIFFVEKNPSWKENRRKKTTPTHTTPSTHPSNATTQSNRCAQTAESPRISSQKDQSGGATQGQSGGPKENAVAFSSSHPRDAASRATLQTSRPFAKHCVAKKPPWECHQRMERHRAAERTGKERIGGCVWHQRLFPETRRSGLPGLSCVAHDRWSMRGRLPRGAIRVQPRPPTPPRRRGSKSPPLAIGGVFLRTRAFQRVSTEPPCQVMGYFVGFLQRTLSPRGRTNSKKGVLEQHKKDQHSKIRFCGKDEGKKKKFDSE